MTKRHQNSPQSNLVPVEAQFLSYSAPRVGGDHGNEVVPRCNSKQYSTMLQGVPGASQMTIFKGLTELERGVSFHSQPKFSKIFAECHYL